MDINNINEILYHFVQDSEETNANHSNNVDIINNKIYEKATTEQILSFLKDVFPQYDEDLLLTIYNYTTNMDETLRTLFQMNKEYDVDVILNHCDRNVDTSSLKPNKYKELLASLKKTMSKKDGYTTLKNDE